MDDFVRKHGQQRLVQIASMHAEVRRAEERFRHRQLSHHVAGVPLTIEVREGLKRGGAHALLHANPPQDLHRIRHHLDARADPHEPAGLFVHLNVEPEESQGRGRGEPAHARADDGYGKPSGSIGHVPCRIISSASTAFRWVRGGSGVGASRILVGASRIGVGASRILVGADPRQPIAPTKGTHCTHPHGRATIPLTSP